MNEKQKSKLLRAMDREQQYFERYISTILDHGVIFCISHMVDCSPVVFLCFHFFYSKTYFYIVYEARTHFSPNGYIFANRCRCRCHFEPCERDAKKRGE